MINLKYQSRTIIPNWNEKIVINDEQYEHIITENTIILFELIDYTGNLRALTTLNDRYTIAWAFIRPVGSNGITNTGKQIRLQLYKPGPKLKLEKNQPMVRI